MEVKVFAPAKINLMLDVTGKRTDGYHTLTTIMQSISLGDILTITEQRNNLITVKSNAESIPTDESNIAYKAVKKFAEYTNIQCNGLDIYIEKNIPSQAGLGGGSADAAAVLVGLNYMFQTQLSMEQLCDIGVSIGADVPFCLLGGTKLCKGIGEIITEIFPLEHCHIVVAKGNTGISTQSAFKKIDKVGFENLSDYSKYNGSVQSVKSIGYNRFELVADNNEVEFIKNKMSYMNAAYSAMSGSGSAVFGLFIEKNDAQRCIDKFNDCNIFSALCYPIDYGSIVLL